MKPRRPEVFISATSADLRSCRQLVKEALLTLGCVPVEQTNFPPDYRSVREMLRARIVACDAVVHVAGNYYGAEPRERAPGEPRRSYTQMEYDVARELGKPLYVFVCGDDFAYDPHQPEDEERRALQQAHRAALRATDHLFYQVGDRGELSLKVRELQTAVEHLTSELKKSRSHLARGVAIGLVTLALLGGGVWWLSQRADRTEATVAKLETEIEKQRRYIQAVADAFTQQQAELQQLRLSDEEKFNHAVAAVAAKENVPESQLRAGINLFVAAVRADPQAGFMDRALAEFAQKNFAAAADNAGQAGVAARERRQAAEQLAVKAQAAAAAAAEQEREAFSLQGQALQAQRKFGEAVGAFESALDATPREKSPRAWAEVQRRLAKALDDWAEASEGTAIHARRDRAIALFRGALEVLTPQETPVEWGYVQNHLGNALRAKGLERVDSQQWLDEAAAAFEAALTVRTRAAAPQDWAATQNNLGNLARDRGLAAVEPQRSRLLAEAVQRYRDALTVRDPRSEPANWAGLQNNLGLTLLDQADNATGSERARLRVEATAAFRKAIEAVTRAQFPEPWAQAHNNLGVALSDQAREAGGERGETLLNEAIGAYRNALDVYTRATHPQDWARVQGRLAEALEEAAEDASLEQRMRTRSEIVAMHRAALQVELREALPLRWAEKQLDLAVLLRSAALDEESAERRRLLSEAEAATRAALEVFSREAAPLDWAWATDVLGDIVASQAYEATGEERLQLRAAAVQLRRAVLEVHTRSGLPLAWAEAQVSLADSLDDQAIDSVEPARTQLRREAVTAARAALEVYTREAVPLDWARTHRLLGYILDSMRDDAADESHDDLQDEALASRRAVLEVYTREAFPLDWAASQSNLADSLWVQARYYTTEPEERSRVFQESADACRAALEVYTRDAQPQNWATTKGKLASALSALAAESTSRETRLRFRREEVAARRDQVSIFTRDAFPLRWTNAQRRLSAALSALASQVDEPESAAAWAEAFDGYRAVLAFCRRDEMPQEWASTQRDYAAALTRRAWDSKDTAERLERFTAALEAHRAALEVNTKEALPLQWAIGTGDVAELLIQRGKLREDSAAALAELAEGVALYRSTLEFWRDGYPHQWADNHRSIGEALVEQAERSEGAEKRTRLAQAAEAYRAGLTRADEGGRGLVIVMREGLADVLQQRADEASGDERAALLAEAVVAYRAAVEVIERTDELGWGLYRARLAAALNSYAGTVADTERGALYAEAIARCREGLDVRERSKINAALNDLHLGHALLRHADTLTGVDRAAQLREAREAAERAREVITVEMSSSLHELAQRVIAEAARGA